MLRNPLITKRQKGFTLYEVVIATLVVAAVGGAVVGVLPMLATTTQIEYQLSQKRVNMSIAAAMEEWAAKHGITSAGLPTPFTGTSGGVSYNSAPLNPAATTGSAPQLMEYIRRRGVEPEKVLIDDTVGKRQRVFQVINGLTENTNLFGSTGPNVRLTYAAGVVYTSDCAAPCAAAIPGASPALTTANLFIWTEAGNDTGAAFVSTLGIERAKLKLFAERLRILQAKLTHYVNDITTTTADYRSNHFPANGGTNVGANNQMSCNGFWARLDTPQLNALGLPAAEFATTPWGGEIHYCRDYAPDGTAADTPPHFAALRFHANLGAGTFPAAARATVCNGATNNCSVILTL